MFPGGQNLRVLREQLGLTMRDVENASTRIAQKRANDEFAIPPSRLSDVETKGVIPSIYRLYSLAVIYRRDIRELLSWYGVDLNGMAADLDFVIPPKSHVSKPWRTSPAFRCRYVWIPASIPTAQSTLDEWWNSGAKCP